MKHPVAEANETSPFGTLTPEEFYKRHSVDHHSEYVKNPRGLKLFTQWWTPLPPAKPIAVICIVHGYTGDSGWFMELTAVHFAKNGPFVVCAIDHQGLTQPMWTWVVIKIVIPLLTKGHGFSEGLKAHIPDINPVVDDCISFFDDFHAKHAPRDVPSLLYSESLGGAIALLITLRRGEAAPKKGFDGEVLNGSMCGISDKFKPPWPLEHFLGAVAYVLPTWSVVPTKGTIPEVSFKVDWKRKLAVANQRTPLMRPRAATAYELVRICRELQGRFHEVDVPLLIVHGGDDVLCDPANAEELFQRACSKDKTLRIYPGMLHQIIGEPDENVDLVFGEVLEWLKSRALQGAGNN